MAIPYRTANIFFVMAIWDPTTKFNSRQYFRLYGTKFKSGSIFAMVIWSPTTEFTPHRIFRYMVYNFEKLHVHVEIVSAWAGDETNNLQG